MDVAKTTGRREEEHIDMEDQLSENDMQMVLDYNAQFSIPDMLAPADGSPASHLAIADEPKRVDPKVTRANLESSLRVGRR